MTRFLAAIGTALLLTTPLLAQSAPSPADCEQIRQAVATYGYAAARRHALANYGIEAVKYGDRCLPRSHRVKG
jgi:hypothetical protein